MHYARLLALSLLLNACGGGKGGSSLPATPLQENALQQNWHPQPQDARGYAIDCLQTNSAFCAMSDTGWNAGEWQTLQKALHNGSLSLTGTGTLLAIECDGTHCSAPDAPYSHLEQVIGVLDTISAGAISLQSCATHWLHEIYDCLDSVPAQTASVINYSLALPDMTPSKLLELPEDAVFVVAAGNNDTVQINNAERLYLNFPDAEVRERILLVAGSDSSGDALANGSISCTGNGQAEAAAQHCLLAPFSLGLRMGTEIELLTGTSFSAPLVSALAALSRAHWPQMSARQTTDLLLDCASGKAPGNGRSEGNGTLNIDCLFNIEHLQAQMHGTLSSTGSFALPTLLLSDRYARTAAIRPRQHTRSEDISLLQGFYNTLTRLRHTRIAATSRWYNRPHSLITRHGSDGGQLLWRTHHGRLQWQQRQQFAGDAYSIHAGTLATEAGPARLALGIGLDHHVFAAGQVQGNGQLRPGHGFHLLALLEWPLRLGALQIRPHLGGMYARTFHAARGATIRSLSALQMQTGLLLERPHASGIWSVQLHCDSGLRGSADFGTQQLRFRPRPECSSLFSWKLPAALNTGLSHAAMA